MNVINQALEKDYALYHGDSCEVLKAFPSDSIHYTIFSPPFASLYTYSNSDRDMGNCKTDNEFFIQFGYLVKELYRITKPGRLLSFHCMNIPMMKSRDGEIGIKDFRGDLIRQFVEAGFIYHSEVTIWKNPVTEMQRTKALGLLHKQIRKDSAMSRQGLPDYVVTMRKPGENAEPIPHTHENFPVNMWQKYASPVWFDIKQSNTLNRKDAREDNDEKHICLAEGTLVLTKRGYVPIETITVGEDQVLTNSGEWHTVVAKALTRKDADVVQTIAQGVPKLITTPDHKIMAKRGYGAHPKDNLNRTDSQWTMAKDLNGCYVKAVLPPEIESTISSQEWWIIGRWLADGHTDVRGHQFIVSVGNNKWNEFEMRADGYIGHVSERDGCRQVGLIGLSKQAREILMKCGNSAHTKVLPAECISLNRELSESLYCGYMSGDGHFTADGKETCSSVSRSLLLGMAIVSQKVRGKVASVYSGRPERESVIGNRKIHCREEWNMVISPNYSFSMVDKSETWKKVKTVRRYGKANVWSIEVETDHSYMAEGCIVKNCPLQLDVIERCIKLWTNPGDIVLDPFLGIGSTVYEAVLLHRRGIGCELKESYWKQAVLNCKNAEQQAPFVTDFDKVTEEETSDMPYTKKAATTNTGNDLEGCQLTMLDFLEA